MDSLDNVEHEHTEHPSDLIEKGKMFDEMLKVLNLANQMIDQLGCVQQCDGNGTLPSGNQCQWCDERNQVKKLIEKAEKL